MTEEYREYARRTLRNEERQAVMHLDMLAGSFFNAVEKLRGRLKGDRNLNRDVGMMGWICKRLVREAIRDVEPDVARQILRQSRDYELGLTRKQVVQRHEEVIMPLEDEWQFVHIALESRCKTCLNDANGCRDCALRKLLRRYADEPEPGALTPCGYMGLDVADNVKRMTKQERL